MLFSSLIPVFLLAGVIKRATSTEWEVIIHRTDVVIDDNQPFVYTETPLQSEQTITWYKGIEPDVFAFAGQVIQTTQANGASTVKEFDFFELIDVCDVLGDGSWKDIIGQVLRMDWFPDASCGFEPGDYTITEPLGPLKLDIKVPLECGAYEFDIALGDGTPVITAKYIIEFTEYPPTC